MQGSCEYTDKAVVDSLQGMVLQLGIWFRSYHVTDQPTYNSLTN